MATKKTDNHYLVDKVALRANNSPWPTHPDAALRVLDCYGGRGMVWRAVARKSGRSVERIGIDQRDDLLSMHAHGDNRKVMMAMDLSAFDVIDLDAYGVPYEQLKIVFASGFHGVVFVTFIQTLQGGLNHEMLHDLGFSKAMAKKAPTLCARRGWSLFKNWLALRGVKKIRHRSKARKHYLCFSIKDRHA